MVRVKREKFLRIKDSGCGIYDDVKNKIYDPFFTTKSSEISDEAAIGFGIGLNQCLKLFAPYNIKLDFSSNAKGSEFIVTIPEKVLIK